MKIKIKSNNEIICWILTVLLITSFSVFEMYSWGKIVFVLITLAIYLRYILKTRKIVFPMGPYQKFFIVFTASVFLNVLWSGNRYNTLEKGITLLEILLVFSLVYIYYIHESNIDYLLSAIKFAGYFLAFYTIAYYGLSNLLNMTSRMRNEFANVNTIGLYCAVACFIQVYEILYHKKINLSALSVIPCVFVIAATESRKAIIYLIIGTILLFVCKNLEEKNIVKAMLQAIVVMLIAIFIIYELSSLPLFAGINTRLQTLFNLYSGTGTYDQSAWLRNQMLVRGFRGWLENVIGGIGIGNTGVLVADLGYGGSYLHNNFIELLAGGGMICFVCYYSMYIYIIYNLIKYRKYDMHRAVFGIIWAIMTLCMDFGMVTYYSKTQWFYLLVMFLNIYHMKKSAKEQMI